MALRVLRRRVPTLRKSATHRIKKRTPQYKKCCLLRLPFLFSFLYLASSHREMTERTPREDRLNNDSTPCTQKAFFLRLLPNKVVLIPKKVVCLPKKVDSHPKSVALYSSPLHLTLYIPHQKNHPKITHFLHISKKMCNFAPKYRNTTCFNE